MRRREGAVRVIDAAGPLSLDDLGFRNRAAGVALAVLLASCVHQARGNGPEARARVVLTPANAALHLYRTEHTASSDTLRLIIRDQATFGSLIRKLGFDTAQAPIVDFARFEVIAASLGVQASYGPVISIDSVIDDGNQRRIVVRELPPPAGCAVAQGASEAIDIVVVPARSPFATTRWDERRAQRSDCGDPTWSIYPRRRPASTPLKRQGRPRH